MYHDTADVGQVTPICPYLSILRTPVPSGGSSIEKSQMQVNMCKKMFNEQ